MKKDVSTLHQMQESALALEKEGKLQEARQLLQEILLAHLEDQSGKTTILQIMTAGFLARVLCNLYEGPDDLPAPKTSAYQDLNKFIKIIRQLVKGADGVELITFEDLVDSNKLNLLVKRAADNKGDEADRIGQQLFKMKSEYQGILRVGTEQAYEETVKLGLNLQPGATFAIDDARVIDEIRDLLAAGNRLVIALSSKTKEYTLYTLKSSKTQVSETREPKSGGCFIATAAYGSALAPEVLIFRRFRDEVLLSSRLGTHFADFYYQASPSLASTISRNRIFRAATRHLLLQPALRLIRFLFQI